jgi:hypothetical protein
MSVYISAESGIAAMELQSGNDASENGKTTLTLKQKNRVC